MPAPAIEPRAQQRTLSPGNAGQGSSRPASAELLQRRWSRLSDEDVRGCGGDAGFLAVLLERRYGVDRREAQLQVYEFENGCNRAGAGADAAFTHGGAA